MIWLNINGYAGEYQLSEKGDLRHIIDNKGVIIIKRCVASNGKYYVTLCNNGTRKVCMLHNLYAQTFKVSVKDAMKIIYEGYEGKAAAKDNVRKWLLKKINDCEKRSQDGISMNDEILYLKSFLKQVAD